VAADETTKSLLHGGAAAHHNILVRVANPPCAKVIARVGQTTSEDLCYIDSIWTFGYRYLNSSGISISKNRFDVMSGW